MRSPLIYRDRVDGYPRTVELFEDRVEFQVRSFTIDARTTLQLCILNPDPDSFSVRDRQRLRGGALVLCVCSFMAAIAAAMKLYFFVLLTLGLASVGASIIAFAWRKEDRLQFKSKQDVPMLWIERNGPDRDRFEEFTAELIERIKRAQKPVSADPF